MGGRVGERAGAALTVVKSKIQATQRMQAWLNRSVACQNRRRHPELRLLPAVQSEFYSIPDEMGSRCCIVGQEGTNSQNRRPLLNFL